MVRKTIQFFGRIDVLVNNAGIIRRGNIETVREEEWDNVIEVDLKGTFNCSKAVFGVMKEQGYGKIINISSTAAKMGDIISAPGYAPSKAGAYVLTKTHARQLARYGINVNATAFYAIETDMSAEWSQKKRDFIRHTLSQAWKTGRCGKRCPFLASDEASFITGEIPDVNGGALMD